MKELEMNRETFQLIKSIETVQSTSLDSTLGLRYLSISHMKLSIPPHRGPLIMSLRLLQFSSFIYLFNFLTVASSFYLKFQVLSVFSVVYALLLLLAAPVVSFFTCHYPLVHSCSTSNTFIKQTLLIAAFAGLLLQSLGWILMGFGVLNGASGGIFTLLTLLNSKEWYLFILSFLNLITLALNLLYSFHLEQVILRKLLLKQ